MQGRDGGKGSGARAGSDAEGEELRKGAGARSKNRLRGGLHDEEDPPEGEEVREGKAGGRAGGGVQGCGGRRLPLLVRSERTVPSLCGGAGASSRLPLALQQLSPPQGRHRGHLPFSCSQPAAQEHTPPPRTLEQLLSHRKAALSWTSIVSTQVRAGERGWRPAVLACLVHWVWRTRL